MSPDDKKRLQGIAKRTQPFGGYGATRATQKQIRPPRPETPKAPSVLERLGNIARQTANIGGDLAEGAARFGGNVVKSSYDGMKPFLQGVADVSTGRFQRDLAESKKVQDSIDENMKTVTTLYQQGKISKSAYLKGLAAARDDYQKIGRDIEDNVLRNTDRGNVVQGAAETMATLLSGGGYASINTAAKATKVGAKAPSFVKGMKVSGEILTGTKVGEGLAKIENMAAKIPSVAKLLERNGVRFGKDPNVVAQSVKDALTGVYFKQPFLYHATIEDTSEGIRDLASGNYGSAVTNLFWVAQNALDGGIFGLAFKEAGDLRKVIKSRASGNLGYFDEIAKFTKDGSSSAVGKFLNSIKEKGFKVGDKTYSFDEVVNFMRVSQDVNLKKFQDNPVVAAKAVGDYIDSKGGKLANESFQDFMTREVKYWNDRQALDEAVRAGKVSGFTADEADKLAIGVFDSAAKKQLADTLAPLSPQERLDYLNKLKEGGSAPYWAQHELTFQDIVKRAVEAPDEKALRESLSSMTTARSLEGLPTKLKNQFAKDGYVLIRPQKNLSEFIKPEDTRKLVTSAVKEGTDAFDPAVAPKPFLGALTGALSKIGLSPESANRIAYDELAKTTAANLEELGIAKAVGLNVPGDKVNGGKAILSKLQQYVENKRALPVVGKISGGKAAIIDIRQLRANEIVDALDGAVTRKQAIEIQEALVRSYQELPLAFRGLGDRIVDYAYKVPGFSQYTRLQGAARYSYNPFFRLQEIAETKILSKLSAGNLIWGKRSGELDDVVRKLEDTGLLTTRADGVVSSFSGEAAQDQVLGRLTANITKPQRRDLAGLATIMAEKRGLSIDDMILEHPEELEDALRIIVQYPKEGFISSPLARTLGLAIFPLRYNAKVTLFAAKQLSKLPPVTQYAVIKSLYSMNQWLDSDEGIKWKAENADALSVLKWITPINSITSMMKLLTGNVKSASDLGILGGLPFGVIGQILDSQGLIDKTGLQYNTPYVDPKTGDVLPEYIPETTKARAALAITDLINSTFTYPGRTLGLPGKNELTRKLARVIVDPKNSEYRKEIQYDKLTPEQKRQIEILAKSDPTHDELLEVYQNPAQGNFQGPTLPYFELPDAKKIEELEVPKKGRGRKGKKTAGALPARPASNQPSTNIL